MSTIMETNEELIFGSVKENLDAALREEDIMNACGPFDPYFRRANQNIEYYLACACALERGEKTITKR